MGKLRRRKSKTSFMMGCWASCPKSRTSLPNWKPLQMVMIRPEFLSAPFALNFRNFILGYIYIKVLMFATGGHGSITQPRSVEALETKMSAAQTAFDTFISCKSALGNTVRTEEIPNCMHWKTNQLMTSFFFTDSIWNYFFYYFFHWTSRTCCNAKCFSYICPCISGTPKISSGTCVRQCRRYFFCTKHVCMHACRLRYS